MNPFNDLESAWAYHRAGGFAPERKARMLEVMVELLTDLTPPGVRVLELGAGTGHLTARLLERPHFGHVHATDSAPAMLEVARETLPGEHLTLETLDFTDVRQLERFAGQGIGAVTSSMAFHLAPDKLALFDHLWAVLEPGGTLVYGDWITGKTVASHRLVALERARVRLGTGADASALEQALAEDEAVQRRMGNAGEWLEQHIATLYDAAFVDVDCLWRDFWMGVLVARKGPGT